MAGSIRFRRKRRKRNALYCLAFLAATVLHVSISVYLENEEPGDAIVYSRMAVTLLEQGVFSTDTHPPYNPTLIRLPGYPIFLAGVYSIFGHANDSAVRVVQGVLAAITCALASLLAWNWVEGKKRRRRKAAWWTFVLSVLCPFTAIFSTVLLTETLTIFFFAAMTLAATLGLRAKNSAASHLWWAAGGTLAGFAVFLRPDSGLFALGLGLTLVVSIFIKRHAEETFSRKLANAFTKGALFSIFFAIPFVPWTIRNEHVFGVFQPLAPMHAEAPGEFVPNGYYLWLRTWLDDSKYIDPLIWRLEIKPLRIEDVPAYAFLSDEEKKKVALLFDQYNNSDPEHPAVPPRKATDEESEDSGDDKDAASNSDQDDDSGGQDDNDKGDDDESDNNSNADTEWDLKISPEVDAGFAQIAHERIAARPVHFYLTLPAERASSMWFDTHSDFYPFNGELFPLADLDNSKGQQIWLPLFGVINIAYTMLAFAGALILFVIRRPRSWLWLFLVLAISIPRIIFFGTIENPEPRYLVELFIPAAILGGIFLTFVRIKRSKGSFGIEINYRDR